MNPLETLDIVLLKRPRARYCAMYFVMPLFTPGLVNLEAREMGIIAIVICP